MINNEIKSDMVNVVAEDGKGLQLMKLSDAIELAEKTGEDIVCLNDKADIPVVKIAIINLRKTSIRQKKTENESQFLNRMKFEYDLNDDKLNCVYARITSKESEDVLNEQITYIKKYMVSNGFNPDEVYSDVASGYSFDRDGIRNLIDAVISGAVKNVFITDELQHTHLQR